MMIKASTLHIDVSVEPSYQSGQSRPELDCFIFSYRITITNSGEYTVQLLSRYWDIFDSCMERRIVEGEGVVGVQPVISPGESYQYESFCQLKSEAGSMKGFYTFIRQVDDYLFDAVIPEFTLLPDYRKN